MIKRKEPAFIYSEALKLLALTLMLIDHIGYLLYPEQYWLRIIGRLAFPLFIYQLIIGFEHTRDKKKMFIRLLLFFLLSLLPFWWMTESLKLNIFATLSCGFLAIWLIEQKKYIAVFFVFLIPFFIPMDYGWYGVAMIMIAYLLRQSYGLMLLSLTGITCIYVLLTGVWIQLFAVIGFLFAPGLTKILLPFKLNKFLYYLFYPLHIIVLIFIERLV